VLSRNRYRTGARPAWLAGGQRQPAGA